MATPYAAKQVISNTNATRRSGKTNGVLEEFNDFMSSMISTAISNTETDTSFIASVIPFITNRDYTLTIF